MEMHGSEVARTSFPSTVGLSASSVAQENVAVHTGLFQLWEKGTAGSLVWQA